MDYTFHITLAGALALRVFEQIPEAIPAGYPSFKVFTTNVLPPHPKRAGNRLDFGRIHYAMEKVAPAGGIMVVHGEDEDLVQFNYERFREEKRMDGTNLHLVHTKLSESLAFRAHHRAGARRRARRVYFVHTSAREGVEAMAEARAPRACRSTARRSTSTRASTPSTTRRRAASARTPIRRSSCPRTRQALWHGLVVDGGSRRSPPTSTRRTSS